MEFIAKVISVVTSPKLLMGATLILPSMMVGSFIIPVMTIIVTGVTRVWENYREGEDDASFENNNARQVRYNALLLGVISFLLASGVAYLLELDPFLTRFYLVSAATFFVILIISAASQTRLSLHSASLGLAIYFINGIFVENGLLLVLIAYLCLLPFVGWSRIVLGKHTIMQVLATAAITVFYLVAIGGI